MHHLPEGSPFWFSTRREHWRASRVLPHHGVWRIVFQAMFSIQAVCAFIVHVIHKCLWVIYMLRVAIVGLNGTDRLFTITVQVLVITPDLTPILSVTKGHSNRFSLLRLSSVSFHSYCHKTLELFTITHIVETNSLAEFRKQFAILMNIN